MVMGKALHQMSAFAERVATGNGEAVACAISDEADPPRHGTVGAGPGLLAQVLARENMQRAWKRVKANKGAIASLKSLSSASFNDSLLS